MVVWNIKPNEKVENLKFGDDRAKVREILGNNYTEFKKSKLSKNTTDDFGGFHVFYDEKNRLEAIEFFEGVELKIDDIKIFPGKLDTLLKLFDGFIDDGYGFINKDKSIGLTNKNETIESILVGKKDYYR